VYKYLITISVDGNECEYYFEYGNNSNQALINLLEYVAIDERTITINLIKEIR